MTLFGLNHGRKMFGIFVPSGLKWGNSFRQRCYRLSVGLSTRLKGSMAGKGKKGKKQRENEERKRDREVM